MASWFNGRMVSDLDRLLRAASDLLGCDNVSIRCSCSNLEVVYAERDDDQLVITDRGETYHYLSRRDDATFDIDLLDEGAAWEICRLHGVELDTTDPEMYPRIQRKLGPTDDLHAAVASVAAAIDQVNEAATRHDG